jgi:CheY-like chemotaxis protein
LTTRPCGGVLVVEDDAAISRAIVQVLEDEGYAVRTAADGRAALAALQAPGVPFPCVILLDLMMPVMDGWTFRKAQLGDPTLAHIPVVLLTAGGHADAKNELTRASGVLRKPVDLSQLLAAVSPFLR